MYNEGIGALGVGLLGILVFLHLGLSHLVFSLYLSQKG